MKEEIVSFQVAKLAKEKGFDGYCYDAYNKHGMQYTNGWCEYIDDNEENVPFKKSILRNNDVLAPTQALLQKWLREVHGIHIDIRMIEDEEDYEKMTWAFQVITKNLFGDVEYGDFNSYEEALEVGLQEAFKLIEL